jgi:Mn-dependent DtxR family transcriptional regulator
VPAYEWHLVTDEASGTVTISHKQAQTADVFRRLIEDGVTECNQIAEEMKVSPATVSRFAKKGIDTGWLKKEGREYVLVPHEK